MITLLEIIRRSEKFLAERGIDRARREAEELIADALHMRRLDLYLQYDRPLTEEELPQLRAALQRRGNKEPAAYIAGTVYFAGITLNVSPHVLIPRPETEILVEKIYQTLQKLSLENKVLWDVCCGSGCMGLALKEKLPQLQVVLSDLSSDALAVAKTNATRAVEFKQGDLFEPFLGLKCDFFVCNPPYVTEEEYLLLTPDVRNWEPKMALTSGKTGLEFYTRVAKELKNHLNPGGLGWLELGTGQGSKVKEIFESEGWSCHYESDWAGHDRFFFLTHLTH